MNESYALKLCLKYNDPKGFEFLVKKYRKEAFFHAHMFLGNHEDAADACQESFAKAFIAIPALKYLDQFYPWFYTILRNCCLNMIRKRKSVQRYQQNRYKEATLPNTQSNPSDLLEQREEQRTVWFVLQKLNPDFREILVMKYIQGYRYHEISNTLGIPRGTVMSRLYHARRAFKEKYDALNKEDRKA